jgi:hypothetical protein
MAAPLEQRDMPYLTRQSRWILNQHVVAAERELVQRLLASTEMAKFAASGGSGDGLNLGERSGRLALANGLCKDNRDQPKADVPPFLRCSRNDRRLSAVRTKLRWPVT